MLKKFLALTLVLVLASGFAAMASPLHLEKDFATVTNVQFNDVVLQDTIRIGAEGNNYSLDMAMLYTTRDQIKGVGPSFSLDKWNLTFQMDTFIWPEKFAQVSAKYKIADITNMGLVARSDLNFNYKFGMFFGIEL